jgi:hypothetical protein
MALIFILDALFTAFPTAVSAVQPGESWGGREAANLACWQRNKLSKTARLSRTVYIRVPYTARPMPGVIYQKFTGGGGSSERI